MGPTVPYLFRCSGTVLLFQGSCLNLPMLPGFYLAFLPRDVHPCLLPDKELSKPLKLVSITHS